MKDEVNEDNAYNQNFDGNYCVCARPYPDPENPEDEMIQCVVCEDWYHFEHLISTTPLDTSKDELVCHLCMEKLPFLYHYVGKDATPFVGETSGPCQKPAMDEGLAKPTAHVFSSQFRSSLCKCSKCMDLYTENKVSFLTDNADSLAEYEAKNTMSGPSQYEKGMQALNNLDHVRRIDAIEQYMEMKEEIMSSLNKLREMKRVVSKEDINQIFENLRTKKQRLA